MKGDPNLTFMLNDRFTGKLERYMERASEKAQANTDVHTFINDGTPVSHDTLRDLHGVAKVLGEIQDELGAIDGLIKRMRTIESEDDQPTQ